MLDIRFIRENAEAVKIGAERKGFGEVDIDRLLELDGGIRQAKQRLQEIARKYPSFREIRSSGLLRRFPNSRLRKRPARISWRK